MNLIMRSLASNIHLHTCSSHCDWSETLDQFGAQLVHNWCTATENAERLIGHVRKQRTIRN
jgi:hypothetical protein